MMRMTTTSALNLVPRAPGPSSTPAPVSWPPSQYWDGDDGLWSSFALRVGNPEQTVRVLISTASEATWVVLPGGCPPNTPGITSLLTCSQSRGELFDTSGSNTWSALGNYSLGLELNLGYNDPATYGLDTVALGLSNATRGPILQGQVVAGLESYDFYTGLFGLGDQPTNFTASHDQSNLTGTVPHSSFLTTMKSENLIPSLSWAYTAGANYRLKGVFGSLTFGGYDLSRLVPNNVPFDLAPDISRDLVVGLQSITSTAANGSPISLLPSSILTFIDSTFPYIYLPLESCQAFEEAFDLTWNDTMEMYYINDTLHQSLTARNPNFTFQVANSQTGGPTVDIVLPYASFDLLSSYPMVASVLNATRYFPLQRATNETQYTLGRTFLQEAYLITNYEHSNFSVSQARFDDGLAENIIAIPSADPPPTPKSHSRLSRNSIIGLSVGTTALLILIVFLVYFTRKRLRKHSPKNGMSQITGSPMLSQEVKPANISALHEIDSNSLYQQRELPDSGKVELLDGNSPSGSGNEISEMPQSPAPAPLCELGTRHTSIAASTVHTQSDRNKNAIIVKTDILGKSSNSSGTLKESPCVETVISSSPILKSLNLDRPLRTSPQRTLEYLNRALPSIPNSDSTQVSPTKTSSSSRFSTTNFNHDQSSRTSTTFSDSGTAPPETSLDMIWKDYDMSWEVPHRRQEPSLLSLSSTDVEIMILQEPVERQMREHPSLSSLSTNVEIAVPPGTAKSQLPSSASSREGERKTRGGFF